MKLSRSWLGLLVLVPLIAGLFRLRFDVEVLNLLPNKLPAAQGLKIYQQNFSDASELIVTVEASGADETKTTARSLAGLLREQSNLVAGVTWQPAWNEDPAGATELVAFLWLNQPNSAVRELRQRLSSTNLSQVLAEAREELATTFSPNDFTRGYDPFGLTRLPESVSSAAPAMSTGDELFASADGTFRLLFAKAKPDLTSYKACAAWLAEIRRIISAAQASGRIAREVRIHFTGRPVFVTEIAGGMEKDLAGSSGGTLAIIGILFWLTHRRVRPLLWLLLLLVLLLLATTALGGLFLGTINVVSLGFASILLGLAEDFGIVIYQESRSHPEFNAAQLRREVAPGIFWSAVTTAGAFFTLNLSALPGLGQLGTLVAIGIILAAVVMLHGYLPRVLHGRGKKDLEIAGRKEEKFLLFTPQKLLPAGTIWLVTGLVLVGSALLLGKEGPRFDHSSNVLKPKNSEANTTLEEIKNRFGRTEEPLWVIVPGKNESEVAQRLSLVNAHLQRSVSNQLISAITLPIALWPQPENQQANRPEISSLIADQEIFRNAAAAAGFSSNSFFVTENILKHWESALLTPNVYWPNNQASRWIIDKIAARPPGPFLALALIHPTSNMATTKQFAADWPADLQRKEIILSGWELLGSSVFETVVRELPRVLIPIFLLVVISLWLAFRNLKEVALSLVTMAFSGLCLAAAMNLLHWDWNILNLMALPLLLGMGVDYSIHIQLALRRHQGDLLAVRKSVGRALLLAGTTTVAGFGSLAFSSNAGMASLGKACALGIALTLLTAVYLLPVWWRAVTRREAAVHSPQNN